jgi:hypothetical protein
MFKKWLVVAGLLLSANVHAQIVNVQQLAGKAVAPGWSGHTALSADWLAGNSMLLASSGSVNVFWRGQRWLALGILSGAYGIKGSSGVYREEPFQAKVFEHLRIRRDLEQGWSIEAYGQHEYDLARRLSVRALTGGGLRHDFSGQEQIVHGAFGIAYMLQAEELIAPAASEPQGLVLEHRLSSYLTGAVKLTETTALSMTVYVQPRLDALADIRGLIDGSLQVAMTKNLGVRLTYVNSFDTRPPDGVRGFDGTAKAAFVAAW